MIVARITATSGTVRITYSGSVVQAGVAEEWSGIDHSDRVVGTPVGQSVTSDSTTLAEVADASVASANVAYAVEADEGPASDTYTNDGKTWTSPAGANLLFSVLLRPPMEGDRVFVLTMVLALAGLKAVKTVTGVKAMIKWPNDLYVGTKKLAGILTEFSLRGKQVDWAVPGMGINVNWHPDVPEGGGVPATSLLEETGKGFQGTICFWRS